MTYYKCDALLDEHMRYRWWLTRERIRRLDTGKVAALFGVNPSTADAFENDQTIRKDMGFAALHNWRKIIKGNLCAYRATDVKELAKADDPIGPDNDFHLRRIIEEADILVPCWGPSAKLPKHLRSRWRDVTAMMVESGKPIMCFGTAQDGQPRHTLMLAYATPLEPWNPPL